MTIQLQRYTSEPGFTAEFYRVRDFLVRINQPTVVTPNFLWGRWEWMFSLPFLDTTSLNKIAIWEDQGSIVGLATYEDVPGYAYFPLDPDYAWLRAEMLDYAWAYLEKEGQFRALIDDTDRHFAHAALSRGFRPTQETQPTSVIDCDIELAWRLPDGFSVRTIECDFEIERFNRCLWRGFNHEGEPPASPQAIREREISLSGPHLDRSLNMVVVAPNGDYAAYCGMWYDPATTYALVEPVCTDPAYRNLGCGRAAVLEAVKRCGARGAKQAYVGSSQQFYYSIGFAPYATEHWWLAPSSSRTD